MSPRPRPRRRNCYRRELRPVPRHRGSALSIAHASPLSLSRPFARWSGRRSLIGDLLWLATIAFVFAILTGVVH
jgi:hypothetical protein